MFRNVIASVFLFIAVLQATQAGAAVPACGDATRDGSVTASDALLALRTSVGSDGCDSCLCDANGDDAVAASDALCVLKVATGSSCALTCNECGASICGDGEIPPITGDLLGDSVHIDDCLLLDVNSYENDIEVNLIKALDSDLAAVAGATVSVDNRGCDCFSQVARSKPAGSTLATTTTSTTSSTVYEACNCYVSVDVSSPKPLAVVEVLIEPYDGQCDGLGGSLPPIARLDAGVEEECDDGNARAGDGCSEHCLIEPNAE